jgi:Sperm-tail PG-rich repeat
LLVSKLPGPGQYSCEVNVKNGIIYNSKYKSPTYRSFGAALRQSLSVQNTSCNPYDDLWLYFDDLVLAPGPGAYPVPSEFGVYESKYLHQSQSSGKFPTKKEEKSIVVTS